MVKKNKKIKWLAVFMTLMLLCTGCNQPTYRDNEVYIVNKDRYATKENQLVNWLNVKAENPFSKYALQGISLLPGEVLLQRDQKNKVAYLMQTDTRFSSASVGKSIYGDRGRRVGLISLDLETGSRTWISNNLSFIHKVVFDEKNQKLYLYGLGVFYFYDISRNQLHFTQEKIGNMILQNIFPSPLENGKVYLSLAGVSEGAVYYTDTARMSIRYPTKDRLNYKASLDQDHYYATMWRRQNNGSNKEKEVLHTVVADKRGRMLRVIGEGVYLNSYLNAGLLSDTNSFGLTYYEDANQPKNSLRLTDDFVYDAGFFKEGGFYWIGDAGKQKNQDEDNQPFTLHICATDGHEEKRLPLSGSHLYVDLKGEVGYSSGFLSEVVHFKDKKIISTLKNNEMLTFSSESLQNAVVETGVGVAKYLVGDQTAFLTVEDKAISEDVLKEMRKEEVHIAKSDVDSHLIVNILNLSNGGSESNINVDMAVGAIKSDGRAVKRQLHLRYYRIGGEWLIADYVLDED